MVLHVLADAGQIDAYSDSVLAQECRGADSRKLENLRRADRADGQDRLARRLGMAQLIALPEFDAGERLPSKRNCLT